MIPALPSTPANIRCEDQCFVSANLYNADPDPGGKKKREYFVELGPIELCSIVLQYVAVGRFLFFVVSLVLQSLEDFMLS